MIRSDVRVPGQQILKPVEISHARLTPWSTHAELDAAKALFEGGSHMPQLSTLEVCSVPFLPPLLRFVSFTEATVQSVCHILFTAAEITLSLMLQPNRPQPS